MTTASSGSDTRDPRGPEPLTEKPKFRSTTLDLLFDEVAAAFSGVVAYVEGDVCVTYREWLERADSLAAALADGGVHQGDVVALLLPSSIDFAVGYMAAVRLGAVATGINTRLGPNEITAILSRSCPAALIHDGDVDPVPSGAPRPGLVMPRREMQRAALSRRTRPKGVLTRPDEPVCIVWTSGTTGTPKGAWFDHRALHASAEMSGILSAPFDRRSMPLPFAHAGYMNKLWDQLEFVITCVLMPGGWSAPAMLDLFVKERITGGQAVPTQWAKLVELPEFATADLSSLRVASSGSAPVTPELAQKMRTRLRCPVVVRYACTESSTITGTMPDDPPEVLLHTVGRPLPGVELMLVDENLREVPHGETGTIRIRTRCQMRGYWNDPDRTAETLSPDGWILTGDLGRLRSDGNVELCGRVTEMYIRGGYNVYPLEVENVLALHPRVERVAVLGVPAPVIGEIGVAFVAPTDPSDPPTADELRTWCREHLADYKAPDRVEILSELPVTGMLKVDKNALRARL
jgi:acyl-CoA synthetase (AMP-forming)/AMP-acid ligase II